MHYVLSAIINDDRHLFIPIARPSEVKRLRKSFLTWMSSLTGLHLSLWIAARVLPCVMFVVDVYGVKSVAYHTFLALFQYKCYLGDTRSAKREFSRMRHAVPISWNDKWHHRSLLSRSSELQCVGLTHLPANVSCCHGQQLRQRSSGIPRPIGEDFVKPVSTLMSCDAVVVKDHGSCLNHLLLLNDSSIITHKHTTEELTWSVAKYSA